MEDFLFWRTGALLGGFVGPSACFRTTRVGRSVQGVAGTPFDVGSGWKNSESWPPGCGRYRSQERHGCRSCQCEQRETDSGNQQAKSKTRKTRATCQGSELWLLAQPRFLRRANRRRHLISHDRFHIWSVDSDGTIGRDNFSEKRVQFELTDADQGGVEWRSACPPPLNHVCNPSYLPSPSGWQDREPKPCCPE